MFRLNVLQAEYGDCLVLEFGSAAHPRYVLIDGGPEGTFERHLQPYLQQLGQQGHRIELAMLSHVDNDHIIGLLDLLAELRRQQGDGEAPLVRIGALWHNSFAQSVGDPAIEPLVREAHGRAGPAARAMGGFGMAVRGISEGHELRSAAQLLELPVNAAFPNGHVLVDDAAPVKIENLTLHVVGPTRDNLNRLRKKWLAWIEKHRDEIESGDALRAARADRSVPNLSSICVLAEAHGRTILLTGDARGDHILQGLSQAGLLGPDGALHVDVLKMPHHGSSRNLTPAFLRTITADTYVISANGRHDNPDLACLIWLVEAARETRRRIRLVFTNKTPSTDQLVQIYPRSEYGYRMTFLPDDESVLTLRLA